MPNLPRIPRTVRRRHRAPQRLEERSEPRIAEIEERVHGVEHRLLPRAVRLIAAGRVRPDPANPQAVLVDDGD